MHQEIGGVVGTNVGAAQRTRPRARKNSATRGPTEPSRPEPAPEAALIATNTGSGMCMAAV